VFCRRLLPTVILAAFFSCPHTFAQQTQAPNNANPPAPRPEWTELSVQPAEAPTAPETHSLPEIKIPNYTSCSIGDLQHAVMELARLKPESDQSQLTSLLDKIGAKIIEIANKTPNLISHEEVLTVEGGIKSRRDFSFLVLQHTTSSSDRVFDEYRVDVKTGEKFQTDMLEKAALADSSADSTGLAALPTASQSAARSSEGPSSQGFVNNWLNFHPSNRKQSDFRYLGEEKMDGHRALVVAFAQKPGHVPLPSIVEFDHKTFQVFMQGIAWVDPMDFKILRLRMDVLAPPPGVPLRQLSSDVQFTRTTIAELASPLWLPREVVITSNLYGSVIRETHSYSNYRLFRTRSKLVLK
jgi:hypothetical protein